MSYKMKMFKDPTPNGTVNARLLVAPLLLAKNYTDLTPADFESVFRVVLFTARKVVSVWRHIQAYHEVENQLLVNPPTQDDIDLSNTLFEDCDDCLVQIKSALDHMTYVLVPIVGAKRWTLRTFGDKGEAVVNALNRCIPASLQGPVPEMQRVIKIARTWLTGVITERDKINHCIEGGVPLEVFAVYKQNDGSIWRPMWDVHTVADALDISYQNLFKFVEAFITLSLSMRLKPEYLVGPHPNDPPVTSREPGWKIVTKSTESTRSPDAAPPSPRLRSASAWG